MSDPNFRLKIDDLTARQGWSPDTLVALSFNFLAVQTPFIRTTFLKFLEEVASEEEKYVQSR